MRTKKCKPRTCGECENWRRKTRRHRILGRCEVNLPMWVELRDGVTPAAVRSDDVRADNCACFADKNYTPDDIYEKPHFCPYCSENNEDA